MFAAGNAPWEQVYCSARSEYTCRQKLVYGGIGSEGQKRKKKTRKERTKLAGLEEHSTPQGSGQASRFSSM